MISGANQLTKTYANKILRNITQLQHDNSV